MSDKRYLVYKSWNGQIHTSIEYGEHTTGEDKRKKDDNELKRYDLVGYDHIEDLRTLKSLFPLEDKK